jgi:hypothetical protein
MNVRRKVIPTLRGVAFVNRVSLVSLANTLGNEKRLLSCFLGSVVLHTLEHSRTDQVKCIVNQLEPARRCYARRERKP